MSGATGGILSLANAFPEICCELYAKFIDGRIQEAIDLHFKVFNLNTKVSGSGGVSAVKAAATIAGYYGGEPRKPLKPLPEEKVEEIIKYLKGEGLV